MRKLKILLFILGFVSSFVFGQEYKPGSGQFKPGSEPDGFGGIKWGTDISTFSDMKYVMTIPNYGGIEIYIKENDELKIGDAVIKKIEYFFCKGKFFSVRIYTDGFSNYENLKQTIFKKFGEGYQLNKKNEYFIWSGGFTTMTLEYNEFSKEGHWGIFSTKILQQIPDYDIKEGSDVIETRIDGDFEGWDGETIFKLENGQIWQQASYGYTYHYAYRPKVFIFKTKGGYKMKVEGVDETIYVRRLK